MRSGTTSIDRELFKGYVNYPKYKNFESKEEFEFKNNSVNELLNKYGDIEKIYPNKNYKEILDYIGIKNFFIYNQQRIWWYEMFCNRTIKYFN